MENSKIFFSLDISGGLCIVVVVARNWNEAGVAILDILDILGETLEACTASHNCEN